VRALRTRIYGGNGAHAHVACEGLPINLVEGFRIARSFYAAASAKAAGMPETM
jgi:hypothetical protein